jgi:hypothetical protein
MAPSLAVLLGGRLKVRGPKLGFVRTVNEEPQHREYRPVEAAELDTEGLFETADVKK